MKDGGKLLGVVSVAKAYASVQPYIDRSQQKIRTWGFLLLAGAAAIGLAFTWRLTRSLNRLRQYARRVSAGDKTTPPKSSSLEISELGSALELLREKVEGKQYVENYIHTLTRELKSPLAAIRGASELLEEDLSAAERERFVGNIRDQSLRLENITEKMLALASVEHRQKLEAPLILDLHEIVAGGVSNTQHIANARGVAIRVSGEEGRVVRGDRFLLNQAVNNLIDNALDFAPTGSEIQVAIVAGAGETILEVRDRGPGIPDYALDKIFDRFYSLPRPGSGKRSTGLGLSFVREVAHLHGGSIDVRNHPEDGVLARLRLPEI